MRYSVVRVTEAMEDTSEQSKGNQSTVDTLLKNDLVVTLLLMGLVVVGVLVFEAILVTALQTEYPLHTPISPSMQPTLNVGDLLIVQGVNNGEDIIGDKEVGDIVVFRKPTNPDEFIVHRVIEKTWNPTEKKYYLTTKGDNNRSPDPWSNRLTEDYVIGKVVWKIPLLGYVKIFLGTQIGMAITIIIFLVLILMEGWK